jgi:hypothetical protein
LRRILRSAMSFAIEQHALAFPSPSILAKFAMVSHNAMAGNSDSDLIIQARLQDRIDRVRRTDAAGDLLVRRGFTDRDGLQCLPHAEL